MSNSAELKIIIEKIALHNDAKAFRQLFDQYHTRLLHLANYYVDSMYASEEIVSMVFVAIWNNRNKLNDVANPEAYIFVTVKNKCANYLRDNKAAMFLPVDDFAKSALPQFTTPASDLLNNELMEKLLDTINELPPRCKLIFKLVKDEGLKYREAAQMLDISVKAIEAQVAKAMITIRKKIYPYLKDEDFERYLKKNSKDVLMS